jgi:uncharacterized protein (TIGR02145 family)
MKKKISLCVYLLLVLGFVVVLTNSCEKDDKPSKTDPVITWTNPADIHYGTLLSEAQLNATSNVPGTFVYTPPIGTMLNNSADQSLLVCFTPTDITAYNSVCKSVIINVSASSGTVTDKEGNVYNTVIIAGQTWMAENLKTTIFNDGIEIPLITGYAEWSKLTTPAYCWYDNNNAYKDIYGALYNFHTVNIGKLCPTGWHVPTDDEWKTMQDYLMANGYNFDGSTTGYKFAKTLASITGWALSKTKGAIGNTDYPEKRNATGFTALPGDFRNIDGQFFSVGFNGHWWSATGYWWDASNQAWFRDLSYDSSVISWSSYSKTIGQSVRCLKD